MIIEPLFPPLPPAPAINVHHALFNRPGAEDIPDHVLFQDALTGRSLTRSGFKTRLFDLATGMAAPRSGGGLGVRPGEVVAIFSANSVEFTVFVHACFVLTAPIALFSSFATEYEAVHLIRRSFPSRIFVQPALLKIALAAAREAGFPQSEIYLLEAGMHGRTGTDDLVQLAVTKDLKRVDVAPVQKDTLAYLVFSSGTSGPPKAVMISHVNLISSFMQAAAYADELIKVLPPPEMLLGHLPVTLAVLPFYHSFGLHAYCLRALAFPQTVMILPRFNIEQILTLIPKLRINAIAMVPSMIHSLVNSAKFKDADLSSLKSIGSGAAYLPPALARQMQGILKSTAELPEGYGLSELTLAAVAKTLAPLFDGKGPMDAGATGILLPGLQARIVRSAGRAGAGAVDAPPGEVGELWLRGSTVALGYFGDAEATRETFVADGWLRTGDRFRVDARGLFWYEDRAKDTLKVGGSQVSPAEIESCIMDMPGGLITDVSVAGVVPPSARLADDEKWPRAWVVLSAAGRKAGEKRVAREVEAWVRSRLSPYKALRGGVAFIDEIPKLPTGKVLRRVLQDKYAAERAAAAKQGKGKAKAKM